MAQRQMVTIDGNNAATHIAHRVSEVIAIYPITPSSTMGEEADARSAAGEKNIWGTVPLVVEMQSEGGAAGAVHGALQSGAMTTTFTASQGLLLMIPNMYKIAGELTSTVFHVSARTVATHALSIFGDHSDVMAARQTGWAMLCSNSVQEVMDLALIATASTLEARVPFLHFFDGFRTSAEVSKVEALTDDDIRAMIPDELIFAHRARALNPEKPVLRGTAQNPDVFFQAREAANPFYLKVPGIVQSVMDKFAALTGRSYHLFDYVGAPDAERVIVMMGSGAEVAHDTVEYLVAHGEKVGLVKVRLYRPFDVQAFAAALPATVKRIAVLDRTKEPGAAGEPLYEDCITALKETGRFEIEVSGGRYGLSSKEFTPAMVMGVFAELEQAEPKRHFTIGIEDDVTHLSLPYDPSCNIEPDEVKRAIFYGLGSDGTVGANKNSIKIIGEQTDLYAQGYFEYDSKKAGTVTVSYLRFGPRPIRQSCLICSAHFVGCHQFFFLEKFDVLEKAMPGAVFLLNSPYGPDEVWDHLPRRLQQQIIEKQIKFYVIDAYKVAAEVGMGRHINTIMQTCFFAISGVLPREEAIGHIKYAIKKTYSRKGEEVVQKNYEAVDRTLANLFEVKVPATLTGYELPPTVAAEAPEFVQRTLAEIMARRGERLPVSAFPSDGTFPTATTQWEKRNIALEIPVWDPEICIQCGKCSLVCPHAVIRAKIYDPALLQSAPPTFKSTKSKDKDTAGMVFTIQIAPEDCTGCGACANICPAKSKSDPTHKALTMQPQMPLRAQERDNWAFFLSIPDFDRTKVKMDVRGVQRLRPLFEFSGACEGCGETPYVNLVSKLFGDRALVANATGCSSIYGGNLPTTPWAQNAEGRGPAWSNSLFEDNAEFGFGFRLTVDKQSEYARELVAAHREAIGAELADALVAAPQVTEADIAVQRGRVAELRSRIAGVDQPWSRQLLTLADMLVKRSVWIIGGDGWAYDIGYGGLDHVLAQGRNVNILVLDTQVYSNTGGQMSKATPRAAVARFAAAGKRLAKKDLGLIAMTYGTVYVAQVAMGASDAQTVRAFMEAESYEGPSLIIAYSHCAMHGMDMRTGMNQQKAAVDSGAWILYRYDPRRALAGQNPLQLDSKAPSIPLSEYAYREVRFKTLLQSNPDAAEELMELAQQDVHTRWHYYEQLAQLDFSRKE